MSNDTVRILCTRPNASECINGLSFAAVADGMLSVPVDRETAAMFDSVPGYRIVAAESPASSAESQASSQRGRKPGRRA